MFNRNRITIIFTLFFLICSVTTEALALDFSKSIVKIFTTHKDYNYKTPWSSPTQGKGSGSGFVIDGNLIVTNAHVVADAAFIEVRLAGRAKRYPAEVIVVSHESDLAIIRPKDVNFFKQTQPLQLGEMPRLQDKVSVVGFPMGGEEVSVTEGIISRIEMTEYAHSRIPLLAAQIDAAINPGNSGGPAISNQKVVGVAHQGLIAGQNIGYIIPIDVVNHFLKDAKDGKYSGIPTVSIKAQPLVNPDIRKYYQLPDDDYGILITEISELSSAKDVAKVNDVLISCNGQKINNDGTVLLENGLRVDATYLSKREQIGAELTCEIIRDGSLKTIKVPLVNKIQTDFLVPRKIHDQLPSYYIIGGLVFQPLTYNYIDACAMYDGYNCPKSFFHYYDSVPTKENKQLVILSNILPDELNVGYQSIENEVLEKVNNQKITDLKSLIEVIDLVNKSSEKQYIFSFKNGSKIVLDKAKVKERSDLILQYYQVGRDRSLDLVSK